MGPCPRRCGAGVLRPGRKGAESRAPPAARLPPPFCTRRGRWRREGSSPGAGLGPRAGQWRRAGPASCYRLGGQRWGPEVGGRVMLGLPAATLRLAGPSGPWCPAVPRWMQPASVGNRSLCSWRFVLIPQLVGGAREWTVVLCRWGKLRLGVGVRFA